jgi:gluconokinase
VKRAFFLAIDMGTSSTRSAIYDGCGKRLIETTAQVTYPLVSGLEGRAELRPEDLRRAFATVLGKTFAVLRKSGPRGPLAGIGVSCFCHSLLGLDARGRAITPVYTWADSRCRDAAAALRKNPGEAAMQARTGCMARASFWPAKLIWLRKTQPALFRRVARWVSPAEWIQETWCGTANVSFSMASCTGLLDGRSLRWDAALLRKCGITAAQLNLISDAPGKVLPAHARKLPELADVPWFPAIGDAAASNLGSGATRSGVAAINVGTSAALRVVVGGKPAARGPLAPFGLFCYRVDEKRRLLGGAVSNAGNLRAWALRELKLPEDAAAIERALAKRSGPVQGLTVLPFWLAERAPTWPEGMPSVIMGATQATTALDLLQALQEATYLRLAQIAVAVEKAAGRRLVFIVSGGINHSPDSLQRLANVLGRQVYASQEPEASLRGAACFAMEKCGVKAAMPKLGAAIRPQAKAARDYVRAREKQVKLEGLFSRRSGN